MAYVDQDRKKRIEALVKPIFKKYGIKARLGVNHHSTLVCNIQSGSLDFLGDWTDGTFHYQVNTYHYKSYFTGRSLQFLSELIPALNSENFDHSDSQTDYFHVGYYLDVNIGKWNKPYVLEK